MTKIALYAHNLHQVGGLSVGRAITSVLPKIAPSHEYLITVPKDRGYDDLKKYPNVTLMELSVGSFKERFFFERRVAAYLKKWRCDWAWVLGNNLMVLPRCDFSVLLHSAFFLNYPYEKLGLASRLRSWKTRLLLFCVKRTIRRSRRVYGQTRTVCRRTKETYALPESRVSLCEMGNPYDAIPQETGGVCDVASKIAAVHDKFRMIYLSAYYLQKNQERVVELFAKYKNELKDVACFLTFAPEVNDATREIARKIAENGLEENVVLTGSVPHSQVASCYRAADACFYPSLLETVGFGHLEAMTFGLPVIASDLDFAHEVCGDAAIFIDPFSLESMRDGILTLKNDLSLQNELRERERRHLRNYLHSWEENLAKVLDVEGIERR